MKTRSFYKDTSLGKTKEESSEEYKSIQIPITEEDIQMFQELIEGYREPFMWTFDKVNVEFIKEEEEEWLIGKSYFKYYKY